MKKKTISLSDDVAEVMASKIKFEAEQHRKNRDSHTVSYTHLTLPTNREV